MDRELGSGGRARALRYSGMSGVLLALPLVALALVGAWAYRQRRPARAHPSGGYGSAGAATYHLCNPHNFDPGATPEHLSFQKDAAADAR